MKKFLSVIFCLVLLFSIIPTAALAQDIDSTKQVSLTIEERFTYSSTTFAIPNAGFDIYYVASVNGDGSEYVLQNNYAKFADQITNLNSYSTLSSAQKQALANDLKTITLANAISSLDSGKTNADGDLTFPTSSSVSMKPGMYLVLSNACTYSGYIYTASPSLVMIPMQDSSNGEWVYDLILEPKLYREPVEEDEKTNITATVVWKNESDTSNRPSSVTVHLMDGSKVVATAVLNASNNWTCTWANVDKNVDWIVTEDALKDYTTSITRVGDTFVVTNTYKGGSNPDSDNKKDDSRNDLPNTGVLWWPIPLMVFVGLVFVLIGCRIRKKYNEKSV